ncbi:hypothetical protein [Streptomyces sp. NPDC018833]|uniref:hypothetical protein n=1 Tax=Streptomyces sp. NPDC018833 TaxID=3365053 RepID=UPI00378A62D8
MTSTERTRYHVGNREIGLDVEYRVECIGTLDEAREWLRADVEAVAEDVEDPSPFDAFLDILDDAEIVGEHHIDVFVFFVQAVEDCGCPCDCAERGEKCDGEHRREAAAEPQLSDADDKGRSTFQFDGAEYAVFNTTDKAVDEDWAVAKVPTEGPALPSRDCLLAGASTRDNAFALAVEKLRPTRLITFMPPHSNSFLDPREEREAEEYPQVAADGWVCAWPTEGYAVLFENGEVRAHIYPGRPVEVSVARAEGGGFDDLDGEWRFVETAALAARAHVLDARD